MKGSLSLPLGGKRLKIFRSYLFDIKAIDWDICEPIKIKSIAVSSFGIYSVTASIAYMSSVTHSSNIMCDFQ
jgi:hypothetical protein